MKWGLRMTEKKTKAPEFFKRDLVKSKRYKSKRDILNALLEDDKAYTIEQVDKMILVFLSKEVK